MDLFDWIGPLYKQAKYDAIQSFDAYIMPSFSEVLSLAVPDAMACGKPCIVSYGCGYSYLMRKYHFGITCEPNPSDIRDAILDLLKKEDEWDFMGREALRCVNDELNWNSIVSHMVEGYYDTIKVQRS